MNILTFDIEEWAIAKAGGYGTQEKYAEYDTFLNRILDVLDDRGFKATFFCTGMMAADFPQVVKLIQSRGHEIGCHSHRHSWMNKMTESEAREDTHAAVDALEQCLGTKVRSYRAPAFSIGESNKWMYEILADNGIECDSSVFPAERDFGGFPAFESLTPCVITHSGISLKEFPISITRLFGKHVAYSGGGYFRLFPLGFIKSRMSKCDYAMCYFHIEDLIPEHEKLMDKVAYEDYFKENGSIVNRYLRYFKSNIGKRNAFAKMISLINNTDYISLDKAEQVIDWEKVGTVKL